MLADKKGEGRCSGDYFFFTVCEIHHFLVLSKRWIRGEYYVRKKKVIRQPHNALMLQLSLSLRDK